MKGSTTAGSWADCPARGENTLKTGCCSALPICSARQRGTGKDRCGLTSALVLGALGITNMWAAIFADVGVMVIAVLNAIRALRVKNL